MVTIMSMYKEKAPYIHDYVLADKLSDAEKTVLQFILKNQMGFKTSASFIAKGTNKETRAVFRLLKSLIKKNVIEKNPTKHDNEIASYSLTQDYYDRATGLKSTPISTQPVETIKEIESFVSVPSNTYVEDFDILTVQEEVVSENLDEEVKIVSDIVRAYVEIDVMNQDEVIKELSEVVNNFSNPVMVMEKARNSIKEYLYQLDYDTFSNNVCGGSL